MNKSFQQTERKSGAIRDLMAVSTRYQNMVYRDFCMASAKRLNLDPIDMSYGDPATDKFIPKNFVRALRRQLQNKNAGAYPEIKGENELIKKFKEYIKKDEALSYDYDLAVVSGGGRSAITNILRIFLKPKDIVLIPYPAWGGYKSSALFLDVIIFPVHTAMEKNFIPSGEDVKAAIAQASKAYPESKVKLMILNAPHNPTGSIYSSGAIEDILTALNEHGIICLADYTYRAIRDRKVAVPSVHKTAENMESKRHLPKGTLTDRIVAMQTLGKISLSPGFRIGYVSTADSAVIDDFCVKKQAIDFSGSLFIQKALAEYLMTPGQEKEFDRVVALFGKRRSAFLGAISAYENWARIALIQNEKLIKKAFRRIAEN